jgi:hypothetical protein
LHVADAFRHFRDARSGCSLGVTLTDDTTFDCQLIPTPAPVYVKYSNGVEVTFMANSTEVDALSHGSNATAQMMPGSPTFLFNLSGAPDAIAKAKQQCRSGL